MKRTSSQAASRLKVASTIRNTPAEDFKLLCGSRVFDLSRRTHIMGIINVTPDSFSDGGWYNSREMALKRAEEMEASGADIIDIGGESTRPGASPVSAGEEIKRVIPVVRLLARRIKTPISADTSKPDVAERAIGEGASMINDVMALRGNRRIAKVIARAGVPVVLMHMKGGPRTMQKDPVYKRLIPEITKFLNESRRMAMEAGIRKENIIIDPGIGFGKTVEHNLEILQNIDRILSLGMPVLVGASRKSFIGKVLDVPVDGRLEGSLAVAVLCAAAGVHMLRVHDVRETVRAVRMAEAVTGGRRTCI